jgi:hypothetical protein
LNSATSADVGFLPMKRLNEKNVAVDHRVADQIFERQMGRWRIATDPTLHLYEGSACSRWIDLKGTMSSPMPTSPFEANGSGKCRRRASHSQ